jgi:DnaJ-class molecular chaperone
MQKTKTCHHCEGKGFIELRDCSGEIQREETCSFCDGTGTIPLSLMVKQEQ